MAHLLRAYQLQLVRRPVLTGAVTSGVLFGLGDIIAQQGIDRKGIKNHDFAATARMTFYGGCIFGPAAVGWYKVLERFVVIKRSQNVQMLARVACDQLIFAPVGIAVFFSTMSVLEGGDPKQKLRESWWTALRANWNIWPAVQVVNFRFVPLDMRVLFANVISIGWNSYLSWLNTQKQTTKPVIAAKEVLDVVGEKA
ncbi:hypothetical protein K440DRAFT_297100 [Wilcoxina mikolae CBS 423.85]|nr:hypothetical protein K440DRAFT_297100 [Wilcoxina mikolae CBS 423.85]